MGKLEAELQAVRQELTGDHAGDWQKLHTLADRERELDALLARRMAEWETASTALAKQRRYRVARTRAQTRDENS